MDILHSNNLNGTDNIDWLGALCINNLDYANIISWSGALYAGNPDYTNSVDYLNALYIYDSNNINMTISYSCNDLVMKLSLVNCFILLMPLLL